MKLIRKLFILFALVSCKGGGDGQSDQEKDGIVKNFRTDGTLFSEVSYKNGKLDGVSKTYHPDGKLYLEETYVNDKRHGMTTQYFQSGILFSETPYDSGKIHGLVKRYHKDGKLKAEAPYQNGNPCMGLKEYILDGSPRPHYPEIVIKTEDKMMSMASYYIHLSLTERVKKAEFFKGNLNGDCFHDKLEPITQNGKNVARIAYGVGPGEFVMEKINIVARIETIAGNILIIQKPYNVAVDFPSF